LFQIADDILDVTQTSETLGKTAGRTPRRKKLTYPSVFGLAAPSRSATSRLRRHGRPPGSRSGAGLLAGLAMFAAGRDR